MTKGSEVVISAILARPNLMKYINGQQINGVDVRKYWDEVANEVNACQNGRRTICGTEAKRKWSDMKFRLKKKYASLAECDKKSDVFTSWEQKVLSIIGIHFPTSTSDVIHGSGASQTVPPPKSDPLPVINCSSMELIHIKKEEESLDDASMQDFDGNTSTLCSEESNTQTLTCFPRSSNRKVRKKHGIKSTVITLDTSKQEETKLLVAALSSRLELIDVTSIRSLSPSCAREAWDNLVNEINPGKFGTMRSGALAKKKWGDLKYRVKKKYRAILKAQNEKVDSGEKAERLTRLEKKILKMIDMNCVADENSDISSVHTTSPSSNVPLIVNTSLTMPSDVEVKNEVDLPEEIPIVKESIESRLSTNSINRQGATIILLSSAIPQADLINGGSVDKVITSTVPNPLNIQDDFTDNPNAIKSVQPVELTQFDKQVLTIIGMNCPQDATVNNSDSAVPQAVPPSPSEINESSEPVVSIGTDDEQSEYISSSDECEEILPDNLSSNEELESPFSHAVLEEEVDLLLDALKSHPNLIHRSTASLNSRKAWKNVTKKLNFKGSGLWKSTRAVQQKWLSLKCRVKKKFMAIQESKFAFEEVKGNVKPLTKLDTKVLSLLDIDYSKETEISDSLVSQTKSTVVDTTPTVNGTTPTANCMIPTVNGTTPTVNGITPTVNGITPTVGAPVNIAGNNWTQSKRSSEVFLQARLLERKRTTARVNHFRQKKRTYQQIREEELLSLKRESIKIKRQALEEHRKTNVLLQRILQLKCQEMKTHFVDARE